MTNKILTIQCEPPTVVASVWSTVKAAIRSTLPAIRYADKTAVVAGGSWLASDTSVQFIDMPQSLIGNAAKKPDLIQSTNLPT